MGTTAPTVLYVFVRIGQICLSAATMYLTGVLLFWDASDWARISKRSPRGGKSSSSSSSSTSSSSSYDDDSTYSSYDDDYYTSTYGYGNDYSNYYGSNYSSSSYDGLHWKTGPRLLLAAAVLAILTAIASVSVLCCASRKKARAMTFFLFWDPIVFLVWLVGMAILAKLMSDIDAFSSSVAMAIFMRAALSLAIVAMITFLISSLLALWIRKNAAADAQTNQVRIVAPRMGQPPQNGGYVPVPMQTVPVKQDVYVPNQFHPAPSPAPQNMPLQQQQQQQQWNQPPPPQQFTPQNSGPQQPQQTYAPSVHSHISPSPVSVNGPYAPPPPPAVQPQQWA